MDNKYVTLPHKKANKSKSPIIKKGTLKGYNEGNLIVCLLEGIKHIHKFHLITNKYNVHLITGDLYPSLQEKVDCLAETYLAKEGTSLPDGPDYSKFYKLMDLIEHLKEEATSVEFECECTSATVDEICRDLYKACYKLNMD